MPRTTLPPCERPAQGELKKTKKKMEEEEEEAAGGGGGGCWWEGVGGEGGRTG